MKECVNCGRCAINQQNGREEGIDIDLCDVCYWKKRAGIWQPIKTAPNGGDYFLVRFFDYGEEYICSVFRNTSGHFEFNFSWAECGCNNPTHWMPLPKPPTE
jgi:hypothetical protein